MLQYVHSVKLISPAEKWNKRNMFCPGHGVYFVELRLRTFEVLLGQSSCCCTIRQLAMIHKFVTQQFSYFCYVSHTLSKTHTTYNGLPNLKKRKQQRSSNKPVRIKGCDGEED